VPVPAAADDLIDLGWIFKRRDASMRTKVVVVLLVMTALVAFAVPVALAAEPTGEQMAAAPSDAKMKYFTVAAFSCAIGIAIAAFGGALGQGRGLASAVEGIARNPGATGRIQVAMIIGLALIESLVIYALVVALIILFANPFGI
jgi:F-type H+-transporting ATPase subunit c